MVLDAVVSDNCAADALLMLRREFVADEANARGGFLSRGQVVS